MFSTVRALLFIMLLMIITACGGQNTVGELPTLAVLPSATFTPTPTFTQIPTFTPIPTNTLRPTTTLTPTFTPSPTATVTSTPSLTPTASITPTATLTYTPSYTPSDTPTATAEFPTITRLDALQSVINPGDMVTLRWISDSDFVTVEVQDEEGNTLASYELPPRGEQAIPTPSSVRDLVVFRMTAQRGSVIDVQSVAVDVDCGSQWFFDASRIEAGLCPDDNANAATGRYQQFERGYMIWVPTSGINRVYVLYNNIDGGPYETEALTSATKPLPALPDGRVNPQNEFEGVWIETNAPTGNTWEFELGWGTANAEEITVTVQNQADSDVFFIGVGNGRVFRINPDGDGDDSLPSIGQWRRVP